MKFTGYDLEYGIIFSKNAFPLTLSEIEGLSVTITVSYKAETYTMTLTPDKNGKIELDLQGILRSLAPSITDAQVLYANMRNLNTYRVQITASSDYDEECSFSFLAIDGGIDTNPAQDEVLNTWLTWRPEVSKTYAPAYEELSVILNPNAVDGIDSDSQLFRHRVLAKVYLNTGEDIELELADGMLTQEGGFYLRSVNVSLELVADALHNLYSEYDASNILAYDVYGLYCKLDDTVLMTDAPAAQRFIVRPAKSDLRCFLFRNSLGVFETVCSTGAVTRIITPDVATFITGRSESELVNKSRPSFKVHTGSLDSSDMVNLWQDFFLSGERYLVSGLKLEKIIVDEGKSEAKLRSLSDMEVTYHLATQPAGRFRRKNTLNTYNYDEQ